MNAVETYTQTSGFRAPELLIYNDSYRYAIKPFADYLNGGAVTSDAIRDYFRELNTTDLNASTIRVRRQAVKDRVRRRFEHASQEERDQIEAAFRAMDRDPDTKCPKAGSVSGVGRGDIMSPQEFATTMAKCRSQKQRLFISFLFNTGARVSEMCGVTLSDCKADGATVRVRLKGKGNKNASYKERYVAITHELYREIRAEFAGEKYLFETGGGKPYSRSYVSNQIAKVTENAIQKRLSAHKLRHSYATREIKRTGRISAVSRQLGHSDISITVKYYDHDTLTSDDILAGWVSAS